MPGKNRAVFLDRDGTIVEDPGYLTRPEQLKLLDGAADAIARLRRAGYLVIVATNQSAIARGMMTEDDLTLVHDRLSEMLAAANPDARLDAIYYCPYHPSATVSDYKQDSYQRKPRPGMLYKAAREHQLNLPDCWMIGDSERDVQAGKTAGCRGVLLSAQPVAATMADHVAVSLAKAADCILVGPAILEFASHASPDESSEAGRAPTPAASGGPEQQEHSMTASTGPSPTDAPGGAPSQPAGADAMSESAETARIPRALGATKERLLREIEDERRRGAAGDRTAEAPADRPGQAKPTAPAPDRPADDGPGEQPAAGPPLDEAGPRSGQAGVGKERPLGTGAMRHILAEILQQLRQLNRGTEPTGYSTTKILAGVSLAAAFALLMVTIISYFNGAETRTLLFWSASAIFMQLVSLTFFMMRQEE